MNCTLSGAIRNVKNKGSKDYLPKPLWESKLRNWNNGKCVFPLLSTTHARLSGKVKKGNHYYQSHLHLREAFHNRKTRIYHQKTRESGEYLPNRRHQMAASPAPPPPSLPYTNKPLIKTATALFHSSFHRQRFLSRNRARIQCEQSGFENGSHHHHQQQQQLQWTVDCVAGSDPIHIILKPPAATASPMPMNSGLKSSKKVCLFYAAEMEALAKRIAAQSDAIELRSINWRKFEDGFPNLSIPNAHGIRGEHVAFLASFSSPGVIFEQLSISYALPKLFISSFTLVLPFFPTGTSERMEDEGDIATAFTLARFLSNIPISRGGPTSVVIYDIHALQISIAFPDDGAWKRFHKQLQHFPVIICAKVREGDQRIVRIKEGDPKGRHVVIVDDLVQSGGTLIECQKVLAKHGAKKVSAYVTHGVFPKRSWERFTHDTGGHPDSGLTFFWITDSCPLTVKEVKNKAPFEVLSLASSIAATLQI
ncbi:Phosphoribosyltransferase domain-containing protein [Cynara cardunculus var. scolymus]|uniref:Phosphoribosyltransferase domain-containing protein n=1 Tax=Cynara cardunculus var. scolymus TaxID=59895 RepID=A0A118K3E1_CYNCS|nr:Phosphoribosyltransferase domain-containing protein [Cynara cardunculus var. scolymus]